MRTYFVVTTGDKKKYYKANWSQLNNGLLSLWVIEDKKDKLLVSIKLDDLDYYDDLQ